jgi:hypothetical protein
MKIEITKQALLKFLSEHMGTEVTELVVVSGVTMADMIREAIGGLDYKFSQKIMAIKALRQLAVDEKWVEVTIGLGDAKWAVENFNEFIAFIEKNNRLPKPGYSEGLK